MAKVLGGGENLSLHILLTLSKVAEIFLIIRIMMPYEANLLKYITRFNQAQNKAIEQAFHWALDLTAIFPSFGTAKMNVDIYKTHSR